MKKLLKFIFVSGSWVLIPVVIMISLVVILALLLGSPVGAFIYTLF